MIITNVAIAKAAIIAIPVPKMYISVGGKETTGYGEGVDAASETPKAASEYDGQYDSVPPKLAMTVYFPGISGCHRKLYLPLWSVVAVPMLRRYRWDLQL